MGSGLGFRLIDPDEVPRLIRERLMNGWVLVVGEPRCIERLEYEVYTPGTVENRNFEALMASSRYGFPLVFMYFARKTPRLRELLNYLSDEEYDTLLMLVFHTAMGEDRCLAETIGAKRGMEETAISRIIERIREITMV